VDESTATGIDPDVIDVPAAHSKEHEIPRSELAIRHARCRRTLRGHGARHGHPKLGVREEYEATAIEAGARGTAISIRSAEDGFRDINDVLTQF